MKIIITLFLLTAFASAQLTGEARLLKEKRDAKIAEIDRIYKAELEKIKLKELKANNADAALAIAKELGEETDKKTEFSPSEIAGSYEVEFPGKRIVSRSFTKSFLNDENGNRHKYEIKNDTITVTWDKGSWEKLSIVPDTEFTFSGTNSHGDKVIYRRVAKL